jgi:hypothetical protein
MIEFKKAPNASSKKNIRRHLTKPKFWLKQNVTITRPWIR